MPSTQSPSNRSLASDSTAAILRCDNIIQKGLAFRFDWSGSVHASGRALRPRNPAPPAFMAEVGLRWWRQMKAVRPRMEDSDANGPNPEFT